MSVPLISAAPKPFRGCLLKAANGTSVPSGTMTALNFTDEVYDTDSFHDTSTNNARITIPAGVKKVRLTGSASITSGQFLGFLKNGSLAWAYEGSTEINITNTSGEGTVSSHVLEVTEGDYFELGVSHSSGTTKTPNINKTYFSCEVVA